MVRHLWLVATLSFMLVANSADSDKNKQKNKSKSFHPVVMTDPAEYAGIYLGIDSLYSVEVRSGVDGALTVVVHDGGQSTTLTDVRRNGAHLQGLLSVANGKSELFTATFVERDLNGNRAFGLLVDHPLRLSDDVQLDRLFCKRR